MKNVISLLVLVLLLASCNEEVKKSDGYVVNGTANGVYNGMRVYLNSSDERGRQTPQDTAIVMDNKFKFEGKIEYPQMWFLSVSNIPGAVPLIIENEVLNIEFDKQDIGASTVDGTKSNVVMSEYNKGFIEIMEKRTEMSEKFNDISISNDSLAMAKLTEDFNKLNQETKDYPINFLKKNNDTYFSLSLVEILLNSKQHEFEAIDEAYQNIDKDILNSTYGKVISIGIDALRKKNESLAMLNIGKQSPDFSAPTPDGKQISLNDIKGKATIIDFWAAWCGPCRRENPNVVNVYNKYHKKGLEIIGVSLDRPGQKEQWLKAIEDDKLTWHHVSNLMYFNDPVAQQYNIQSIPATFILDADGTIVAKNLRGQALEDKIAEMLN